MLYNKTSYSCSKAAVLCVKQDKVVAQYLLQKHVIVLLYFQAFLFLEVALPTIDRLLRLCLRNMMDNAPGPLQAGALSKALFNTLCIHWYGLLSSFKAVRLKMF